MAYDSSNLYCISGATGDAPRVWSYATTDTAATVNTSGYFNNASQILNVGDKIYAAVDTGGTPDYVDFVVLSNASGVVDVSDGDSLTKADVILNGYMADISTAGQIYVVCPVAGDVKAVYSAINGAIAMADATLTVKTAAGTVGTITVANSGSAAGDVDSLTSGLLNTAVAAGATIEVETDGASTNTVPTFCTIVVTPSSDAD